MADYYAKEASILQAAIDNPETIDETIDEIEESVKNDG
jgi:hypothetical protein